MAKPKKTHPPRQAETIAPDSYRHIVGKGITERHVYSRGIQGSRNLRYAVIDGYPVGSISSAKAWAEKFLKEAGLPAHIPTRPPAVPWGTGSSVQARHYRERQDPEWYAYEILETFSEIHKALERRNVYSALEMAYRLGNLATEAHGLGYYRETGKAGGSKEKTIRPLMEWLRRKLNQYPGKSYTFFWNSLPEHDDGDSPVQINGATMIREGGVLVVTENDGRSRSLTLTSFRRYVATIIRSLKQ